MNSKDNQYGNDYLDYQLNRSFFRRMIRKLYLTHIKSYVIGNAIDYGCGSGELLGMLGKNSAGFEINPSSVDYCKKNSGLNVFKIDVKNKILLPGINKNQFSTFIMSHVLEHLDNPEVFFDKILEECRTLGITRMIFVVPGKKGFATDATHRHFIDEDFFKKIAGSNHINIKKLKYFPFNFKSAGNWFTHNELVVVIDLGN